VTAGHSANSARTFTEPTPRDGPKAQLILILAGLSAASPLATDMYVAGLPDMAHSLGTDTAGIQVSLTGFLAGIIVGQLVWGPLSDRVGRRPVLLWGTSLFVALSCVCALAPNVEIFNVARAGQGLAGAAGIVVARAVVTDLFEGVQLARTFSALGATTALGPILAPLLGGLLLSFASWRSVFVLLTLMGLALIIGVLRWVPESLRHVARTAGGLAATLRSIGLVARQRDIAACVLTVAFGGAAVFAYIAGTSFIFQGVYHLTPAASSLVYGTNAVGNMAGSLAFGRLATRWRAETLLVAGGTTALAGAATLLITQVAVGSGVLATWSCLFISISAFGVFFPAVTTVAQERGRQAPGATSALLGSGQFTVGAIASPAVGLFGTGSPAPMAAIMTVCLILAALAGLAAIKECSHRPIKAAPNPAACRSQSSGPEQN
jgi:MFS transporter, DHA1 family, multidrug resistance protein